MWSLSRRREQGRPSGVADVRRSGGTRLAEVLSNRHRRVAPSLPLRATHPGHGSQQGSRRLHAADEDLYEQVEAVRQATISRNSTAFRLASGQQHRKEVVCSELVSAATDAGLGLEEARRTFERGWRAGVRARTRGRSAVDATSSEERLERNALRDRVWASGLCSDHKLVMLAVLHYMNAEGVAWPTVPTLGTTASMSRSRVTQLLKDLVTTGWIEKGAAPWVRTAGPKPNGYRPPRLIVEPRIPPHRSHRYRASPGRCAFSGVHTGGPVSRPATGASGRQAGERPLPSEVTLNSASAPNRWKTSRPPGVAVSMDTVSVTEQSRPFPQPPPGYWPPQCPSSRAAD